MWFVTAQRMPYTNRGSIALLFDRANMFNLVISESALETTRLPERPMMHETFTTVMHLNSVLSSSYSSSTWHQDRIVSFYIFSTYIIYFCVLRIWTQLYKLSIVSEFKQIIITYSICGHWSPSMRSMNEWMKWSLTPKPNKSGQSVFNW